MFIIVAFIIGNSDLMLTKLKAGERATSLVSRILAFGRKRIIQPKVLDFTAMNPFISLLPFSMRYFEQLNRSVYLDAKWVHCFQWQ
jgi:hypothetical protein